MSTQEITLHLDDVKYLFVEPEFDPFSQHEGDVSGFEYLTVLLRPSMLRGKGCLKLVLPSEKIGKHKTAWQMVTVIYFLVLLSLAEMQRANWFFLGTPWEKAWHIGI